MELLSVKPLLAGAVALLAVIPIVAFGRRPNVREGFTLLAAVLMLGIVLSMLPWVLNGHVLKHTLWQILPQVAIEFRVDGFGLLFALVASSLWIVTSIYATGYMRALKEHSQTRFFAFFAVSLSATLGVAFSANLLTMYVFYEMLSLSTYPLVTHHQDREARTGGRTYLTYLLGTSIGFALPAIIYCYVKTGGALQFSGAGVLAGHVDPGAATVLLLLLVFGFAKSGLMPFHSWLPAAMVAPTPVSALLHAVAVVKVGVFCVFRIFTGIFGVHFLQDIGVGNIISAVAAVTVVVSSLIALSQDSLKRRLAFSTIGQLAYITLGVSLLAPKGVTGSQLHIAMHAFGKITLFFCAGAIFQATGKKYISDMIGIGKQMPVTMTAFAIGAMSVVGLPLTGGLLSKFYLVSGTVESGRYGMMCVYLLSSLLNAAYFFPIVFNAFFCKAEQSNFSGPVKEAHPCCVIAVCVTAGVSVFLFFSPDPFLSLASMMTKSVFAP
ncbi:MAG: monovalent cation/H+ antiporter subunit D family protein [Proteobacteria bacterium]|nr:monovalent cation/H+ antiporter subunit D family protein [Pseudomonadota bacterium]